jgi:hypothetical protein
MNAAPAEPDCSDDAGGWTTAKVDLHVVQDLMQCVLHSAEETASKCWCTSMGIHCANLQLLVHCTLTPQQNHCKTTAATHNMHSTHTAQKLATAGSGAAVLVTITPTAAIRQSIESISSAYKTLA